MRGKAVKIIDSECLDAAYNLELEKFLLEDKQRESYVLFWQCDNTIVLGRHQKAEAEVCMKAVEAEKTAIVRRSTGGGAVYQDLGNLNFSFITESDGTDDYWKFLKPVAEYFKSLGVMVTFNQRNDLLAEGRKFSGSAQLLRNGRVLHHGTLLLHSDLDKMDRLLLPHPQKLARNQVVSVRSRVGNLFDCLPPEMRDVKLIKSGLQEYLKKVPFLLNNCQ